MFEESGDSGKLILPVGTHVVTLVEVKTGNAELACPVGAVGVIIKAPTDNLHSYRVRLPNGSEVALRRNELAIRKHYHRQDVQSSKQDGIPSEFRQYIIYRCVIGSKAYGLDESDSDTDRRGIYLPPAELHWSIFGVPEQLEDLDTEECYWELQKFLLLALKANPNILECLYAPVVEDAKPLAQELLEMRSIFLSKLIYQTYNGYVMSQFKKLEQDLRTKGEPKWKHAMHLVRLLISGITILKDGFVPVQVSDQREKLLAIRRGEMSWPELNAWRLRLHKQLDNAFLNTRLPERPDYDKANTFLIKARQMAVEKNRPS